MADGPDVQLVDARPRLRGVLHVWAFLGSLLAGTLLVASMERIAWPAVAFALSVSALFGTSALYHRVKWSPPWYARVRRLDHAMIFVLIMGSYAPLLAAARGVETLSVIIFAACSAGVLVTLSWTHAPKWLRASIYLAVGWMCVLLVPALHAAIGMSGLSLLFFGGALYSAGAIIYALRRPDPIPDVFGYHEIFHALVIAAVSTHFVLVRFWIFDA